MAVSIDTCTALARFIGHLWRHNPMRVGVPAGFCKPLTCAHKNPCLWMQVWVLTGAGAGYSGKPQSSLWHSLISTSNMTADIFTKPLLPPLLPWLRFSFYLISFLCLPFFSLHPDGGVLAVSICHHHGHNYGHVTITTVYTHLGSLSFLLSFPFPCSLTLRLHSASRITSIQMLVY